GQGQRRKHPRALGADQRSAGDDFFGRGGGPDRGPGHRRGLLLDPQPDSGLTELEPANVESGSRRAETPRGQRRTPRAAGAARRGGAAWGGGGEAWGGRRAGGRGRPGSREPVPQADSGASEATVSARGSGCEWRRGG